MKQTPKRTRMARRWLALLSLAASAVIVANCASTPKQSPEQTGLWFSSVRESILEHVEDPGRARRALVVTDRATLELLNFAGEAERQGKAISALHANYDTTRAEFEAAFADIDASSEAALDAVQQFLNDLKALVEPEEWSEFEFSQPIIIDIYAAAKGNS